MQPAPYDPVFVQALIASYAKALSEPLIPARVAPENWSAWLYEQADFAVLAHDTAEDPVFVYANLEAQRCFERAWPEIVGLPSRLSAEAPNRAERAAMLARVAEEGYSRDYRGIRVARSGRRFWIERGIIWNVWAADGTRLGQAATFRGTTPV